MHRLLNFVYLLLMKQEKPLALFGDWRKIAIIFAVALIVRLIHLIAMSSGTAPDALGGDPAFYDSWARSILEGNIFPDTAFYRAPLYPYFVSVLYAISGGSVFFVGLVQMILGSISCVLAYVISRRFFAEKASLVAGLVMSLYGVLIHLDTELLPTTLAIFLLLLGVFVLSVVKRKSPLRPYFIAGLFVGLASLAQTSLILFGLLAIFWLIFGFRTRTSWKLARWGVLLAGMAVVISPVTVHNVLRSGDFILISSDNGINLFAGNNVESDGSTAHLPGQNPAVMYDSKMAQDLAESVAGERLSPAGVSAFFAEQALMFFENFPRKAVGLLAKRSYMLLNGYEISDNLTFYFNTRSSWLLTLLTWDRILSFPMGLIIPLFVVGVILTAGNWRKHVLLYVFVLSAFIWPAVFFVNIQTRAAFVIPVIMIASAGLLGVIRLMMEKKYRRFAQGIAVFLIVLFVSNCDLVELKERGDVTYLKIGSMHWNRGDYVEAEKAFNAGLAVNPDSPQLLNNLGNVYFKRKIYEEAERKYRRALAIDPGFIDARKNLIRSYETRGRIDALYPMYTEFLHYFPNSKWCLYRIADYFVEQLQNDSALVYYERLLSIDPNDPDARFGLASVYTKMGRAEEARTIYEDMLRIYPEEPRLHLNLGLTYLQLGMDLRAEEEFGTVLFYDSSNTFALYNIARMLEARGDTAVATSVFLRIMTIDPDFFENSGAILDSFNSAAKQYDTVNQDSLLNER